MSRKITVELDARTAEIFAYGGEWQQSTNSILAEARRDVEDAVKNALAEANQQEKT